ncbi:MAG: OmpH family outer membrane protein [Deltaproteobacteria bacterium]|nr:OmpH family outer membrane protein [Deltaproteobacteria bacterium]MBW2137690.1 OmpH family outer membrane protein [Deltaproteobacteria bacterium]
MKKTLGYILPLLLVGLAQGSALGADPGKIGFVDIQKFQKNSKAFLATSMEIRKKFESLEKKLSLERKEYQKLEEEFKKQSMMLSLDAQEDKKRELERKKRYIKYLADDYTQEMKSIEMEERMKIVREIGKIVREIGKEEGYALIVEKRAVGIIYANPAVDLTDRVIEAYDKINLQQ